MSSTSASSRSVRGRCVRASSWTALTSSAHAADDVSPKFALSSASVYPETTTHAFEYADRLGYDAVEVMVGIDEVSQSIDKVRALRDYHHVPVCAVHAPCLLITPRVGPPDPLGQAR